MIMNLIEESTSTKEKILEAADSLFAKNGFAGTSIRDIAQLAQVNLAAVNYHFKTKENLYWQVFEYNYEWIALGIQSLNEEKLNTVDFSIEVFRFFLAEKNAVTNIFKILLSGQAGAIEEPVLEVSDPEEHMGPPGYQFFIDRIAKDVGPHVSLEAQRWAMKTIFTLISHNGLMMCSEYFKNKCKSEETSQQSIEHQIRHAVQAVLDYLKNNSNKI